MATPALPTDDRVVVDARVRVFWDGEGEWFEGVIAAYSASDRRFLVHYDDGEEQWEVRAHTQ